MTVDELVARRKLARLHRLLAGMDGAVVAFSGGADSTFLAFVAHRALGQRVCAVTADSPSLARSELREATELARRLGLRHQIVATGELDDRRYVRNRGDRCYFCKDALMRALLAISAATGQHEILVGVNLDDLGDHRPGQRAVRELGGRWSRSASQSPRSAGCPGSSPCRPGTSPLPRACPPVWPTACR